jgi:sugar lactone lactonase YvrE
MLYNSYRFRNFYYCSFKIDRGAFMNKQTFSGFRLTLLFIMIISLSLSFIKIVSATRPISSVLPVVQGASLKIVDPKMRPNPVVNEGNKIALMVVDNNNRPVTDVTFRSGSPDIADVDGATGVVQGRKQGFATITALRRNGESVSEFIVVSKVEKTIGERVPGGMAQDTSSRIYISDPQNNVILRKDGFSSPVNIFAGKKGNNGRVDGRRTVALFDGPTAVAINAQDGAIYIADTLNHSIRKIDFKDEVSTALGNRNGSPGINSDDETPFDQVAFSSPRGVAADIGGNLFIADTENHAIYVADFTEKKLTLLAGLPDTAGKADGQGRSASFTRPSSIAVSKDGRSIAVADSGNNSVRLITRDGIVTTIKRAGSSSFNFSEREGNFGEEQQVDDFDAPRSVSFDDAGNIYVVDNSGVQIITDPMGTRQRIVFLAQDGTFGEAVNVVVQGTAAFVLDDKSASETDALTRVTVGAPEIASLSLDSDSLAGGSEVIITGKNFAPESQVVLGDNQVVNFVVRSATEIQLIVPSQSAPGIRTLSVQTRGGVAQRPFFITAKLFKDLSDGGITTVAGGVPFLGDGGNAVLGKLNIPFISGLAIDSTGNLFIGDSANNRVRRVNQSGIITTVAGNGNSGFNGDNIPAISAGISSPAGIAIDGEGNLFIAERRNQIIRRVDASTGLITTMAGTGDFGFAGDGGPAITATLAEPTAITVDSEGNLFIVDAINNRVRRVDAKTGIITTVAGNGQTNFSGDGGPAIEAGLFFGLGGGVAIGNKGDLFIADSLHNRIRRVNAETGIIMTVAGSEIGGSGGDGGAAIEANLLFPINIALDVSDNLFIADMFNARVRRVDAETGIITTIVGGGTGTGGDGGPASDASVISAALALDGLKNLFIADISNRIRRVDAVTGIITTVAGGSNEVGDGGPATKAALNVNDSFGIAIDGQDSIFLVNDGDNRVRRIDSITGVITTVAGNGVRGFSGDGGPASSASLAVPKDLAMDESGNLFIADTFNNRIRRIDSRTGIITTIAGNGQFEFSGDGGPAAIAGFNFPRCVAVDRMGNIFVGDTGNSRVRRIDIRTGIIKTIAGNGSPFFSGDGGPATGAGLEPTDLFVDREGNLLIADQFNGRIRRVDSGGNIITVAGGGGSIDDNIPALNALLSGPGGMTADSEGNLFFAETFNNRIRRIDSSSGLIITVAGTGSTGFSGDGGPAITATLAEPSSLALDKKGNLFIIDTGNSALRAVKGIVKGQVAVTISGASFTKPNLTITGAGFGSSGASVNLNGQEVGRFIVNQTDTQITLRGNKKKLNLKKGQNQLNVTAGGVMSNTFTFNFVD